ncbi:hypothetical protein [Halobacteriovorax sp.]|uniref:hypothetical protein n=1 Tax=Halobacteriovorax sp. TaxID=2020862 RepID=UPI003567E56B
MKKLISIYSLFFYSVFSVASTTGSLQLSSKIGVNIDYRIDENNNVRIISNAPYKKNIRPYFFKSKNIESSSSSDSSYKVLEIAAN